MCVNPHSQAALVAGMVRMRSKKFNTCGYSFLNLLLTCNHVVSDDIRKASSTAVLSIGHSAFIWSSLSSRYDPNWSSNVFIQSSPNVCSSSSLVGHILKSAIAVAFTTLVSSKRRFSLCHYYENLTNLPLNKSEGPYTTKLVKLYITYFVIFKLFKLLKLFSLSGSFLFLKVEVTPNKSSSWILMNCFVKLAQSEHSLQNVHNKHGQHGWKVSANCQNNATFFIFLSFKVWFWDWKFMEYIVPKIWHVFVDEWFPKSTRPHWFWHVCGRVNEC